MNRERTKTMVAEREWQTGQLDTDNILAMGEGTTRTADSARPSGAGPRQLLRDRFICPENGADFVVETGQSGVPGYFQLGSDTVCYGHCSNGRPAEAVTDSLHDALDDVVTGPSSVRLSFDPLQIIDNLRRERYRNTFQAAKALQSSDILRKLYYAIRPALGVSVRRHFQKFYFRGWHNIPFPKWPVDATVESIFEKLLALSMKSQAVTKVPFVWYWPDGSPSCAMLTHDVETSAGLDFCPQLMDLNDSFGIKSSFQVIPEERYTLSESILEGIRARGFEVNVHDSNHDGRLTNNRDEFFCRVQRINAYGRQFGAQGFRSAGMYRNTDWYDALDFSYDMSIPNTAHLEPQQGGCCTVFPFFIGRILELPLTTIQDYTLLNILNHNSIELWREQISLIRQKSGLISFIVHPDYITKPRARRIYADLLNHLCELRSRGETWIALPAQIAEWWRLRSEMRLVNAGGSWSIQGKGSERARLAYAVMSDNRISYEVAPPHA